MTESHHPLDHIIWTGVVVSVCGDIGQRLRDFYDPRPTREAILDSEWLAEHDRQVRAEAWDEGYSKAWYECLPYDDTRDASESTTPNPYRSEGGDDQ